MKNALFINAILIIAIIMFVKEFPKFLSDATGIKSEGMSKGLKASLGVGKNLTAGTASLGYANAKGAIRGFNKADAGGEKGLKGFANRVKNGGFQSAIGGGLSSQYNAARNGAFKSNSLKSVLESANKGITQGEQTAERYKNNKKNFITGGLADMGVGIGNYLGTTKDLSSYTKDNEDLGSLKQTFDTDKDLVEKLFFKQLSDNKNLLADTKAKGLSMGSYKALVESYSTLAYEGKPVKTTDVNGRVLTFKSAAELANFQNEKRKDYEEIKKKKIEQFRKVSATGDSKALLQMLEGYNYNRKTGELKDDAGRDINVNDALTEINSTVLETVTSSANSTRNAENHVAQNKIKFDKALAEAKKAAGFIEEVDGVPQFSGEGSAIDVKNLIDYYKLPENERIYAMENIANAEIRRNNVKYEDAKRDEAARGGGKQ